MEFIKNKLGYYQAKDTDFELSYPGQGNEDCYEIEDNSNWFQARNLTIEAFIELHPFKGDFMDIGGGNGFQLKSLNKSLFKRKNIKAVLCEPGINGCINAAERGLTDIYNCSYEQFPFDQHTIGGVGLFDVIEHIEDDVKFLDEIAQKLPVGGRIYIAVPALSWLWSKEDEYAGHFRRYNVSETKRLIKSTGLKCIYTSYFFSYYTLLVWLLRVFPEFLGLDKTSEESRNAETNHHKNNSFVTRLLNFMHNIELSLQKIGIKPIFGTSRFIVLEKG